MNITWSSLTGTFSGAPCSFQSGKSSLMALGSSTAPDKIWAPTSEPFSTTQMVISLSFSAANWASLHAVDNPAGPAPTITTSNSIDSLSKAKPLFINGL